jgi:hypothetical protein
LGKNTPNFHKIHPKAIKYPKSREIDQMAIKYTNIFRCKTRQELPNLGFLV